MERRHFLGASFGACGLAATAGIPLAAEPQQNIAGGREYYELRRYHLVSGPQQQLARAHFSEALIPALNRLGMSPIGAFDLDVGPETPATYLLIPSTSLDALVTAELKLGQDEEYQRSGHAFLNAPATAPPYERVESSLMAAFEGHPKVTPPPVAAQHGTRVFQLRTYESPTSHDHRLKVEMFHSGEFGCFERAGFWQVFYGDTLIGSRLPNLTYMLSFPDLSEMNAKWKAFRDDPVWKKLSASSKFSYESIVSNISNLILNPASYSQI